MEHLSWSTEGQMGGGERTVDMRLTKRTDGTIQVQDLKNPDQTQTYENHEQCTDQFAALIERDN